MNSVVPVSVESVGLKVESAHLLVRNPELRRILLLIEVAVDLEPGLGSRAGDEIHDGGMSEQRLTLPALADEREQSVLDLVPFAGSRRKMTDGDAQSRSVGQLLKLPLPKAYPGTVTTSRIRRNEKRWSVCVSLSPELFPPASDRRDGELGGVMVNADTHPADIPCHVVHPVGDCLAQLGDEKIVHTDSLRLPLGTPRSPCILEVSDKFLLLRVDGDGRAFPAELSLDLAVDVLELRVTVRVSSPFPCFVIRLQTVAEFSQQGSYDGMANSMALSSQLLGKLSGTLERPPQGRSRVASGRRLNEVLQVSRQRPIQRRQSLSATSGSTDSRRIQCHRSPEFTNALRQGLPRDAHRPRNSGYASTAKALCFSREHQASGAFVKGGKEILELLANPPLVHRYSLYFVRMYWEGY
jgi:hypothetical protein